VGRIACTIKNKNQIFGKEQDPLQIIDKALPFLSQINLQQEESVLIIGIEQNHDHRSALGNRTNTIDMLLSLDIWHKFMNTTT
jgi:hypothetical protein